MSYPRIASNFYYLIAEFIFSLARFYLVFKFATISLIMRLYNRAAQLEEVWIVNHSVDGLSPSCQIDKKLSASFQS